jgi:DNA-binding transcriptional ArsR family regulator
MKAKYLEHVAALDLKSVYSYRILLLLHAKKTYTLVQLAELFDVPRQNMTKPIKELLDNNLIELDRQEGKNKFYRAVNESNIEKVIPGQVKIL